MALDRAVQLARQAGDAPPTLRLYRWARATVTLGRFQSAAGVDRELCAREGIDVVRRFTGGRGVLHDDELTYSIVRAWTTVSPAGRPLRTACFARPLLRRTGGLALTPH